MTHLRPISKEFLGKPGTIPRHLWTFVEPWVLARQRFEEKSVVIEKLERKRDNLFVPVAKVLHDGSGKPMKKVIREDLQRQLWDEEYTLRIPSAREQCNTQLGSGTNLHATMLTNFVEHFKYINEANILDCCAASLLPGQVNRTMESTAYQDVLTRMCQGAHPKGFDAALAKKANVIHLAWSTLEGLLSNYGVAMFHNWNIHQQSKQVASDKRGQPLL